MTPENAWKEYPRPAMVRDSYLNLNGLWEYCFTDSQDIPEQYDGEILVPFSPESELSGVERQLKPGEYLWYRRQVTIPFSKKPFERARMADLDSHEADAKTEGSSRWILHFGAVDQECHVYLNGYEVGEHIGGYLPFSFDITDYIDCMKEATLIVRVQDVSDTADFSRGKQKLQRGGMFYTAQSGIWQTVWMEQVPETYVTDVQITPDYDRACAEILIHSNRKSARPVEAWLKTEDEVHTFQTDTKYMLSMPDFHAWSPEDPFLYDITIRVGEDQVSSYFAMRKCDIQQDDQGVPRLFLNHQPYFQAGVLDQGYWPEGLYTAPCDEAMVFDIISMKKLGFNMLRKHIKIEPQRWYYHCDRLGMLVWQDMVCGGSSYRHWFVTYLATVMNALHISVSDSSTNPLHRHLLSRKDADGREMFRKEVRRMIEVLRCHPSIVCWVPFNEGWGQFDAKEMAEYVRTLDKSRLIDHASGWFDQKAGDIQSIHYYFFKLRFRTETKRATAITEYGGKSWQIPEHSFSKKLYGYGTFQDSEALSEEYRKLHEETIIPAVENGVSATIYTQVSDIEDEVNGIYTYDREILKISADVIKECNQTMIDIRKCCCNDINTQGD